MGRAARFLLALAMLFCAQAAYAHLTPNSEVNLTLQGDGVDAQIIVPAAEYAYASGNAATNAPDALREAREYLSKRMKLGRPDGKAWPLRIETVRFAQVAGPPDLFASVSFMRPPDASDQSLTLNWSVVVDEVPDHFALVGLREGASVRVIGAVRQASPSIVIEPQASTLSAIADAAWLGALHIAEGYDHLLFLLALLLAAPLVAKEGRWIGIRDVRATTRHLVKIVTGFTIGHSVTLIGAGLGNWQLPSAPVEAAIAASVILTAVHAVRPIFPGREAWVAFAFGLVHGLAFATLLATADSHLAHNLPTLAGFNIGIELVQLGVLIVLIPPYLYSLRMPSFGPIRASLGIAVALCGAYWFMQRAPALIS